MNFKIRAALSIFFVLMVSVLVARGCIHRKTAPPVPKTAVTKAAARPLRVPPETPGIVPEAPTRTEAGGRMAIILDDWGNSYALVKDVVSLGKPLTLAILPNLSASRRIAEEASRQGLGVMLHMPMQPKGAGHRLEAQTILTTTPDAEIRRYLDEALAGVPFAEGVNNHMGSAATCDTRVMRQVLAHLQTKGLFFVDSNTIAGTVSPDIAAETGIPFAKRDVFIDNVPDLDAIKSELRRAVRIALRHGSVVVIGHDKPLTIQAVREMLPEIERAGVRLVRVRELVRS